MDMIVRIVAAGNLVRGDEIRASIELYPNRVIYRNGELIIARVYTAEALGNAAEQSVMAFLREVNAARGFSPIRCAVRSASLRAQSSTVSCRNFARMRARLSSPPMRTAIRTQWDLCG